MLRNKAFVPEATANTPELWFLYETPVETELNSLRSGVDKCVFCGVATQVDEEYKTPGSQKREALGKMPQMWGQSLYVLASLVKEVCRSSVCSFSHTNLWAE